ncbi:MAG: tetratricopeptide repeat protein, partial [Oligoflexia bacterium]|nr:tetratricopeptide repeat protein [Oligoflexia bacterium]
VLGVASAAAVLSRALAPRRVAAGVLAAGLALLSAWVLLWKGPGLARMVVLDGMADGAAVPAAILRLVPLTLAAALTGSLLGLAWGPRRVSQGTWLGIVLGGALAMLTAPWAPLWVAGAVGGSAIIWTLWRPAQLGGLLIAAACISLAWVGARPDPAVFAVGAWPLTRSADATLVDAQSRSASVVLLHQVDPRGAVTLRVPSSSWDPQRDRPLPGHQPERTIEQDGLLAESVGRGAEAETLAGHLAGLLAPQLGQVLVLGDDLAQALGAAVQHDFSSITVATPAPAAVRSMAMADPQLRAAWLDPRVRLAALPPGPLLATVGRMDAIIEIARAPWSDSFHVAPTPEHLNMVLGHLRPDGIYILVLHLAWVDDGRAPALASAVANRFPVVQAWLPPFGADSLILVASKQRFPLARLRERLKATPSLLDALDASIPEDLASLAVTDRQGLLEWHKATNAALPSPLGLGRAPVKRPVLHLSTLADHLAPADRIWVIEDPDATDLLAVRSRTRQSFLRLLGKASSGDIEGVFRQARELQRTGGQIGAASLDPLIDPHLADARRSLARARTEGPTSAAWDDALRYATTARMLAPSSPRPLVVLGEIALGKGQLTAANDDFGQALELDPHHVPALTGQARTARARGDSSRAIDLLRSATNEAPGDWRTWENLGVLLLQEDQLTESEQALRQAVMLTDGKKATPQLALAELMLDDGRAGAALLTAEGALAQQQSGYGWYLRGRAHYELGEKDRAEEDFQRAVIADPNMAEARGGIGLIQAERGELDQAAETFRAVLRLQPGNRAARENLRRVEADLADRQPDPQ